MESTDMAPSVWEKIVKISKESPGLPIGIAAFAGIVGHGIYSYKKSNMKLSLFLIHYRVMAQGALVGCLTLGILCKMIKEQYDKFRK